MASNRTLYQQVCNISAAPSGAPIFWRVRTAGNAGVVSPWSDGPTALAAITVRGSFAAAPNTIAPSTSSPVRLRATTRLPAGTGTVRSALAFVASPGYYQLFIGGRRVNPDTEYGPWPEWNKRVYYDCWNVTDLLATSDSSNIVLGLRIGLGTYGHGALTGHWSGPNFAKGYNESALPLLFELHLETEASGQVEGSRHVFASGGKEGSGSGSATLAFHAHADPIKISDWYQGEVVDNTNSAALDQWDTDAYNMSARWQPTVEYAGLPGRQLTPTPLDPIVRLAMLRPVQFFDLGGGGG